MNPATANPNKPQGPVSKSAGLVYQGLDGRILLAQGFTPNNEPTGPYAIMVDTRPGRKPEFEVVHAHIRSDAEFDAFQAALLNAHGRMR